MKVFSFEDEECFSQLHRLESARRTIWDGWKHEKHVVQLLDAVIIVRQPSSIDEESIIDVFNYVFTGLERWGRYIVMIDNRRGVIIQNNNHVALQNEGNLSSMRCLSTLAQQGFHSVVDDSYYLTSHFVAPPSQAFFHILLTYLK